MLTVVSDFYEALCACASMHPDPRSEEDDMFGEDHQWITADNFEDAEGDQTEDGHTPKWRRME